MKKIGFFILLIIIADVGFGQLKIDVLHYRYEVTLDEKSDTISVRATIHFVLKDAVTSSNNKFKLDLVGKSGNKGMEVARSGNIWEKKKVTYHSFKNNEISFEISETSKIGDTLSCAVSYQGIPGDGLIISKNKFNKKTFFADNWPNRAHYWLACVDDPADKAGVEFIVTAPDNFQVIANGIQIEETNLPNHKKLTHYREDIPLPTKIMVIGVAEFAVQQSGLVNDCIPVSTWVFPENKTEGFSDYSVAPQVLQYYINLIGPYAYKKLANIQSKTIFGGMENAGAIFYFENSVNGRRDQETLFAHEIVHQWFGNMATEKSFAHLWLSEGFATYLTHMYVESKYGRDSMLNRLRNERDEIIEFTRQSKRPVVDSTADYMSLLNANSYQKGSWVLHMLRNKVGDSIFRKAIRQYYSEYAGKNAETRDLERVFEKLSGRDMRSFFDQWLYRAENPDLVVTWKYDLKKKVLNVHVEQMTSSPFDIPLDLSIMGNPGAGKRFSAQLNQREQDFTFPMSMKPSGLVIDDKVNLLHSARISEMR